MHNVTYILRMHTMNIFRSCGGHAVNVQNILFGTSLSKNPTIEDCRPKR